MARERADAPEPLTAASGRPARALWDLAEDTVHVNHGSYGAVPTATTERQIALIREMNALPGGWFSRLPERVAAARHAIAEFIGADPQATALVPNASAGVSAVLASLDLAAGTEIVVTDHAYGAVRMAAERAVRRVGGHVREAAVPLEADEDEVAERITRTVSARTALVIIDQISSATARVFPVAAIARRLRTAGVPLLVDAAHAPGMVDSPAPSPDVDFWVGNLHKWGCTPRGTAALVASGRVSASLYPLIDSWGAPHAFPTRFDTQGTVDLTAYLAAPHALTLLEREFGWSRVRAYGSSLVARAQRDIAAALEAATAHRAFVPIPAPAPMMRLVELPAGLVTDPEDAHVVSAALARLGFQTAITFWRGRGFLRLSAHAYNTAADYDAFIDRGVPAIAALASAREDDALPLAGAAARVVAELAPT